MMSIPSVNFINPGNIQKSHSVLRSSLEVSLNIHFEKVNVQNTEKNSLRRFCIFYLLSQDINCKSLPWKCFQFIMRERISWHRCEHNQTYFHVTALLKYT